MNAFLTYAGMSSVLVSLGWLLGGADGMALGVFINGLAMLFARFT